MSKITQRVPYYAMISKRQANTHALSAAPRGALNFMSLFTQGFISGFALITPWAKQECRAYGTHKVRPLHGLKKDKFLLVLLWGFAECGFRKALRLKAQGVYFCK